MIEPSVLVRRRRDTLGGGAGLGSFLLRLLSLLGGLSALRRLSPEFLRKALHAAFRVNQLLPAREERVALIADFQVQLGLGLAGLERVPARAPDFDVVVLRMNAGLHGLLLSGSGKTRV